jgi:hypothetical protein
MGAPPVSVCCVISRPARREKFGSPPPPSSQPTAVHGLWTTCGQPRHNRGAPSPDASSSPRSHGWRPPDTQSTHSRMGPLACTEPRLSPDCTAPSTTAHFSSSKSSRRRGLGKAGRWTAENPSRCSSDAPLSPRWFSFQVGAESSTVVHRQPFRSSQRVTPARCVRPGNRCSGFIGVHIEGTL